MDKFDFFYGNQLVEFERPEVPNIIAKKGIKTDIVGRKYKVKLKPTKAKVVVKVVYYKTE